MSYDDNSMYISIISLVVSIISSIITFWISWTISGFYYRKNKVIHEINFYLSFINLRINKFNQTKFLNNNGKIIDFKFGKLDDQFPVLCAFFKNGTRNGDSLDRISNHVNISLPNLKIICNIFKELQDRYSKIISYIDENYIKTNTNYGETLSEYNITKDIAKNNQVSIEQVLIDFNKRNEVYLRFDENQISSSFTQSFSFDTYPDRNRNKYKTKALAFFTNLESNIKNIDYLFVIKYCELDNGYQKNVKIKK